MPRTRLISAIAAATLGITVLGACSTESLTERAVGFGLEQAVEGDQDIDLDFGDDGGGFSISTDEGDFAVNFDEDRGGIVFNTDEGNGVISFDEDGIVFNTDEGDGTVSFDEDDGTINFDTDEGDGQINFSNEGSDFVIETEDGSLGIFNSTDAPANWPSIIARPLTLVAGSESYSSLQMGSDGTVVSGVFQHSPEEPYGKNVVATLTGDGWTVNISSDDGNTVFAQLAKGDEFIQVVSDSQGYSTVTVNYPAA